MYLLYNYLITFALLLHVSAFITAHGSNTAIRDNGFQHFLDSVLVTGL